MLLSSLLLIFGLVLLIKGAQWMVDGASALAKRYNVSDLAIGLTVVAFGTSAPELVVNVIASSQSHHDIVFGNVLGSNIANVFLVLGITGLIYPLAVQSRTIWREIPMSLFAAVLLFFLANNFFLSASPVLSRGNGMFLFGMFLLFMYYMYTQLKFDSSPVETVTKQMSSFKTWAFIVIGLAGLVAGGKLVIDHAVIIATELGVSEKIIGFTIVAIGTSLPELATSVVAALKKNTNIAVGNIVGSNIFNIFLIISVSSMVKPISFNRIFNTDFYFLTAGTLFLFAAMFMGGRKKLDRWEAAVLLLAYIGYTGWLVAGEF
jgi:cation:H+ antiporter